MTRTLGWAGLRMLLLLLPVQVLAQAPRQPVATPFLMINTEMHVGPITTASATPDGRLLATGSGDKSIRLFDAGNGRFLRRLYLPLGDGGIGTIFGLGLSPDGRSLVAGTVSFDHDDRHPGSLYLVDTATGRLRGRIAGLQATPLDLAYAPDGSYFAVALGRFGIVARRADGHDLFQDPDHPAVALAIAPGLLAAAAPDGRIRLYTAGSQGLKAVDEIPPRDSGTPLRLAFAADGRRLAIGYLDRSFRQSWSGRLGQGGGLDMVNGGRDGPGRGPSQHAGRLA
jgi:WD40 repeat protein